LFYDDEVEKLIADMANKVVRKATCTAERVIEELEKIAFANIGDYAEFEGDKEDDITECEDGLTPPRKLSSKARWVVHKAAREQLAAIQDLDIDAASGRVRNVKLGGKQAALELLGKYLVMWTDRHEHTGLNGAPLVPPALDIHFVEQGGKK
jgi:hypothetical protein